MSLVKPHDGLVCALNKQKFQQKGERDQNFILFINNLPSLDFESNHKHLPRERLHKLEIPSSVIFEHQLKFKSCSLIA